MKTNKNSRTKSVKKAMSKHLKLDRADPRVLVLEKFGFHRDDPSVKNTLLGAHKDPFHRYRTNSF